ncbi:hypothetical protein GCM10020331_069320 [Ectobacillus funiculus]
MVTDAGEVLEKAPINLPGYQPNYEPNRMQIAKLLKALQTAEKACYFGRSGCLACKKLLKN